MTARLFRGASLPGLAAVLAACLALPCPGEACFGARLRVGVPPDPALALASYAAGYYVEEKTGIAPEFVGLGADPGADLARDRVDILLAPEGPVPEGVAVRPAGDVPGAGPARFWLRQDVLDDLRFFTVDRALEGLPPFYRSDAFRDASRSRDPARKAARQAVHRAQ